MRLLNLHEPAGSAEDEVREDRHVSLETVSKQPARPQARPQVRPQIQPPASGPASGLRSGRKQPRISIHMQIRNSSYLTSHTITRACFDRPKSWRREPSDSQSGFARLMAALLIT